MTDTKAVLAERGARYGRFTSHALITQALRAVFAGNFATAVNFLHAGANVPNGKNSYLDGRVQVKHRNMAPDQREALDMIAHKIGRILNGDPDYSDSWRDIAGYATLVADRLDGKDEAGV
jgi:hypothetical protein